MSSNPSHPINGSRPRPSSPHFPDRRQSYGGPPPRPNETSYRPEDFSSREGMREPPKGPKAQFGSARGGFAPRGRGGFYSRDRDPRDARDGSFHRRDGEHNWNRREPTDTRERRTPPPNPDRSRSPHTTPFRDGRDQPSRDTDLSTRYNIGIRDNVSSTTSSILNDPHSASSFGRGAFRPRGRSDYSLRGGARSFDDRERFPPRSRSRDRTWTRDFHDDRPRERNRDWEPERRDTEERRHGDEQDQEGDRRRDAGTIRSHSRNSNSSLNSQALTAAETAQADESRSAKPDPTIVAPKGPKASRQLSPQPPINRRSDFYERPLQQPQYSGQDGPGSRFDNQGLRNAPQAPSSVASSPPTSRFVNNQRPISSRFSQPSINQSPHASRANERLSSQSSTRPTHSEPPNPSTQNQPKQTGQQDFGDSRSKTPTRTLGLASNQTSPIAAIPLGPKHSSAPVSIRQTSIPPARPRAQASILGANGHFAPHNIWVNPNLRHSHQPHQPSILQTVPPTANHSTAPKRDYNGEVKSVPKSEKTLAPFADPAPRSPSIGVFQHPKDSSALVSDASGDQKFDSLLAPKKSPSFEKDASPSTTVNGELPLVLEGVDKTKAVDDLSDDEDVIDEDYLATGNATYEKELRDLEARRPPTPRHNKDLLFLLEEIDILASAANDLANGFHVTEPAKKSKTYNETRTGLLSPEPEANEVCAAQTQISTDLRLDDQAIEDSSDVSTDLGQLPYFIKNGPPTPFSEIVSAQDLVFQNIKRKIIDRLKIDRLNVDQEHEGLRAEYKQLYKSWRLKNEELEQQNKALNESTIIDTPPAPVESPNVASAPMFESRGRIARFASELDYQKVIQESKITAEAAQARERQLLEDQALVDLAKEARIPDMLTARAAVADKYRDTNHRLKSEWVLNTFSFERPVDNFTPEEHKIFTEQYMQFPKRFGQVAKALPGRHYEDCVLHYYLTKKEANYKGQLLKKINRKGKRTKQAPQRGPRSTNALMSNMGARSQILNNTETDLPHVQVTDTGRPRRAAAPTFEKPVAEAEQATAAPSITRRGPNQNKNDANSNVTPEKPAKRPRATQPREKTKGKKNAQLLAAAPAPIPVKEADTQVPKVKEPNVEEGGRGQPQLEDAQLLAGFQAGSAILNGPPQFPAFPEAWPASVRAPEKVPIAEKLAVQSQPLLAQQPPPPPQPLQYTPVPEPQAQLIQLQPQQQTRNAPQTSSYWSVPEQNEFPRLLEIYGTDWQQIATGLKNKTAVMVKNYYHRCVENGKNESWDGIAREADERLKHRRNVSNPSQPNPVSKRRFEPSPQSAAHRILAPNTEMIEQVVEPNQGPTTPFTQLSPNQVARTPPQIASVLPASNNVPALAQAPPSRANAPAIANNLKPNHSSRSHRQPQIPLAANVEGLRDPRPLLQAQSPALRQPEPHPEQSRIMASQQQQQQQMQQQQPPPQQPPQAAQQSPQKTQPPIRPSQHPHRASVDVHDFTEAAARLHRERYEPQHQQLNPPGVVPHSISPHYAMGPPPFPNDGRQPGPVESERTQAERVQATPGITNEQEKVSKPSTQPLMPESSPSIPQRRDSIGLPYNPAAIPPPPPASKSKIMSPPQERPNSVPNIAPLQQPPAPRPTPAPAKRSNIMSILNDDPPEPQPRRVPAESQPATPAPAAQANIPVPPYQQQPHQTQMSYTRQEQPVDSHRLPQHHQLPPSHPQRFTGKAPLPSHLQEQHIEQPAQMREQPAVNWPPSGPRPGYEQRHSYSSPQIHPYDQQLPRSVMQQQMMSTKPPSPMMPPTVTQRDSFAHPHGSRPQPSSNLGPAPSPYSEQTTNHSKLQPHPQAQPPRTQSMYSHSSHQDTMNRQHQDPFQRHREDPRAQHETIRQPEYGGPDTFHRANIMREHELRAAEVAREHARTQVVLQQQQESMHRQEDRRSQEFRQHEAMRRDEMHFRNQEAGMRHNRPQTQLHPHQPPQLQYRDLGRQEFVRNEHAIGRAFTPPAYHGPGGFGPSQLPPQHPQHGQHQPPPPPPGQGQGQGQGQQGRGGYEDMR